MQRIIIIAVLGWAILWRGPDARAGLYHQDTIAAFDLDNTGYANPLDPNIFMTSVNIIKAVDDRTSSEAKDLLRAVREREQQGTSKLTPQEVVNLAADLLRLRDDASRSKAMNLLQPLTRRPPAGYEFMILSLQAHAHGVREEYPDAAVLADSALNDYDFPKQLLSLSPEQLVWYRRFEREYYLPFLRQRSRNLKATVRDGLDPIFPRPAKEKLQPVHFIGNSGNYEAGTIAAAEKAKLPPDAIAIVQQLILWNPDDGRLWWQLAELYNAVGDIKAAARIFDQCTRELKYTNRELMEHRSIVMAAVDAQLEIETQLADTRKRAEEEKKLKAQEDERRRFLMVAVGVAIVIVIISYWQSREFIRRMRRNRVMNANG